MNSCAQEKMDQLRLEPRRGCKVDTGAMETEENKPAVSSQAPAIATPVEPSVSGNDETNGAGGQKVNDSVPWLVCLCFLF